MSGKHAGSGGTRTTDRQKAIARRWFEEVINRRNLDAIADIYTPDYIHHGPGRSDMHGREAVRALAAQILAASEDRHAEVVQQVGEGDLVATRFISRGHHTGVFMGLQPTGRIWITEGNIISRIDNGRIAEDWEFARHTGLPVETP